MYNINVAQLKYLFTTGSTSKGTGENLLQFEDTTGADLTATTTFTYPAKSDGVDTQVIMSSDSSRSDESSTTNSPALSAAFEILGEGPLVSILELGKVAKPFTIAITRVYPPAYAVVLKSDAAGQQEVILNQRCHDAAVIEDAERTANLREQLAKRCRMAFEEKLVPPKLYSLDFLRRSGDFSTPTTQAEVVSALFHESSGDIRSIIDAIPAVILSKIMQSFNKIKQLIDSAVETEVGHQLRRETKLISVRPLTVVKGCQLLGQSIAVDEEIELFIYERKCFKEQTMFRATGFTPTTKTKSKTHFVSSSNSKLEFLMDLSADYASLQRKPRDVKNLWDELQDGPPPVHNEMDISGEVERVDTPTQKSTSTRIVFKTDRPPSIVVELCCGSIQRNRLEGVLQPGNLVEVKNVRCVPKRPLFVAFPLSEFRLVRRVRKNKLRDTDIHPSSTDSMPAKISKHDDENLGKSSKDISILRTEIKGFDNLVGGGLRQSEIIELFGFTGTCKTLLCHNICARICHFQPQPSHVLYFDPKHDFDPRLMLKLCQGSRNSLENVRVFRLLDFDGLIDMLQKIIAERTTNAKYQNCRLVIIDGLPMYIYPKVKGPACWKSLLDTLLKKLHLLAKQLELTIILINNAVKWRRNTDNQIRPSLGFHWNSASHIRLYMERITPTRFQATLYNPSNLNLSSYLTINDGAIIDN